MSLIVTVKFAAEYCSFILTNMKKAIGSILFVVGILLTVGTVSGQKSEAAEQKMQMGALAAVFLTIGAALAWGKKKPKETDEK
jgi:drug/metabolite transporter (DMT)-like permease